MPITNEDISLIALQIGNLQIQLVVLEREKRELAAELKATRERLEMVGNPDGLHLSDVTQSAIGEVT